ncbi:MAG: hypothetical protein H0T42_22960, partial [Deltaproteobacteria bacterium]|nr:hypothetical protein [Deltaproteobacteria bacterium]
QKVRRRELLIESIDGVASSESPFARGLLAAGARVDYRGLVVRGVAPSLTPAPPETEPAGDDEDDDDDPATASPTPDG